MIELIKSRLAQADTDNGFILDGFPRTTVQAEALDSMFDEIGRNFRVVFALQIPDEVAFERLRRRAQVEGRPDDTDDAIRRRLENYHRETAPLIEYYRTRGNLVPIHGDRSENEVFAEIQAALEQALAAEPPVRDSGPVAGVWVNREVPSAPAHEEAR
jgi:adenylate kinase